MTYTTEYLRADWGDRVARKNKWLHRITFYVYFVAFYILTRKIYVYLIEQFVNPILDLSLNSTWGGSVFVFLFIPISIFLLYHMKIRIQMWELEQSQNENFTELIIGQMRNLLIGIALLILSLILSP